MKTIIKFQKFVRKNILIYNTICFILMLTHFITAQPTIEWEKNYGGTGDDSALSIQQTSDGGYIAVGYSLSQDGDIESNNNGFYDYWVVKLNQKGDLEWEKNYGGTKTDIAYSVLQVRGGGYIVAGGSESNDHDIAENNGSWDFWILRLNESGNLMWEKNYGGSGTEWAYSIDQTFDGGFVVAGSTTSSNGDVSESNGGQDFWIIKIDEMGILLWEKNYGGSFYDEAESIEQTTDGGFIVAGLVVSDNIDVSENNGGSDYWIIKLDELGEMEWNKSYGGTNRDHGWSTQQTNDGGYIIAGGSESDDGDVMNNNGGEDCWIIKLDISGNIEWKKNYGGTDNDSAYSIRQTNDDGYIVAANSLSNDGDVGGNNGSKDYWIIKLNEQGVLEWEKNYGGSSYEFTRSIRQTTDGGYIIAGSSESNNEDVGENIGDKDFWIVKLSGIENFVYPGDKNNDGIVDQKDVSIAGFLYETGPPRAPENQNTDWYGHPCEDWNDNLPFNGANIKHLDCNGDGTISTTDADAVIENLGETHDEGGQQIGTLVFPETNYQIYLQPVDDLDNDNLLEVNVVLESKNGNSLNLQGGYFTIDYSNVNTNITNAAMNFTNSWLGSPNINLIGSYSNFPNNNQIEIGFSKTNGTNSTGKGIIGQLTFVLDNNAMRTANGLLDFEVIEIGVHDSQGNIQPIEEQLLQVGLNESNCEPSWTITEDSPFYNVYKSNGTIATDGFVLVGKEQQVQYSADRVRLEEGFSVRAGAGFKVWYGSCN